MSLTREATITNPGFKVGDTKLANYDITFTLNQLVEPETGWILLNGAVVSQATYPTLFARYGLTFITGGEGAGNFRLPDHTEGAFPIAAGLTNFPTYGADGGEITHALTTAELPVHTHTDTKTFTANSHGHSASVSAVNGGDHAHSYSHANPSLQTHGGGSSVALSTSTQTSGSGGASHTHSFTAGPTAASSTETYTKSGGISSAGSGTAHNNMMPYLVIGGLLVKYG